MHNSSPTPPTQMAFLPARYSVRILGVIGALLTAGGWTPQHARPSIIASGIGSIQMAALPPDSDSIVVLGDDSVRVPNQHALAMLRLALNPRVLAVGTQTLRAGLQPLDSVHWTDSLSASDSLDGAYVYVPLQCVGKRRCPLLLFLHGLQMDGLAMINYGNVRKLADSTGIILLSPKADNETWDPPYWNHSRNLRKIEVAVRYVLRHYAIDPTRLGIAGASNGGGMSLVVGLANGDVFSRVLGFSPSITGRPPVWVFETGIGILMSAIPRHGKPSIFMQNGDTLGRAMSIPGFGGISDVNSHTLAKELRQEGYDITYGVDDGPHGLTDKRASAGFHWLATSWTLHQSPSAQPVTAFVDVAVIPMDREQVLPHQTVLVQGNRITALGPAAQVRVPQGAMRVDGLGKYLIPGLADMHVHLGAHGGDTTVVKRALFLFVAYGVTTIRNMDFFPKGFEEPHPTEVDGPALLQLRARAATGELLSPRIYTSAAWGPLHYVVAWVAAREREEKTGKPPELDSVAAYVAAYKAAGYDFVKIHSEDSVMAESVLVAAHRVGIPVVGHPLVRFDDVLKGYTSIEHVIHYIDVDSAELPALADATRRAGVWNCPTLIMDSYKPEEARRAVRALQAAGAGLLSGTDVDAPFYNNDMPGLTLHQELAALVQAGLTPYQALVTSTRNVAAYFGTLKESGTVSVGKQADLVLLAGNPLVDIHETAHIAGVMRAGRWFSQAALEPHMQAELKAAAVVQARHYLPSVQQ